MHCETFSSKNILNRKNVLFEAKYVFLSFQTCYPLAFGVLATFMILGAICVVAGKAFYRIKEPEGSIYTRVVGSIYVSRINYRGEKQLYYTVYL